MIYFFIILSILVVYFIHSEMKLYKPKYKVGDKLYFRFDDDLEDWELEDPLIYTVVKVGKKKHLLSYYGNNKTEYTIYMVNRFGVLIK